jgi:hypothetical protein
VECLIKSNLDTLIDTQLKENSITGKVTKETLEQKLLSITVIDPACGSGHFLLAAARRLADRLAFLRANGAQLITDDAYRNSLRDVISSCIYGLDLNPLAVELARMSLWLESHEPGKPLSYLDHHIRCGNSLIGVMDFDALSKGVPDDAYKALSGDDKERAAALRKRNRNETTDKERKQFALFEKSLTRAEDALVGLHLQIEKIQNNTIKDIEKKQILFEGILKNKDYHKIKRACDLYTAAFYAEKKKDTVVPTTADVDNAVKGLNESELSAGVEDAAEHIASENRFFHWRLEFPEIFSNGGFDCVLGNPPWDQIEFKEEEYFAPRESEIAKAVNKATRIKQIETLAEGNNYEQQLYREYIKAKRDVDSTNIFAHVEGKGRGRYPLTGNGRINNYALFAETILQIMHRKGRAGFIVPTGIATDEPTKNYFKYISGTNLVSLYSFENESLIFPDVHHGFKFCLLSLGESDTSDFAFFIRNIQQLDDERRHFTLSRNEFILLNPNTQTCPIFRSEKDAELTKKIYRNVPVLIRERDVSEAEDGNLWGIKSMRMFDMSACSHLFYNEQENDRLPLYEAKMMHQFDHRWATYSDFNDTVNVTTDQKQNVNFIIKPRYWVDKNEVLERIDGAKNITQRRKDGKDDAQLANSDPSFVSRISDATCPCVNKNRIKWLMGWRSITNVTNERTIITAIMPLSAIGNSIAVVVFNKTWNAILLSLLYANLNSIAIDFVARQKIGGTNLNFFYIMQFPALPPSAYSQDDIEFIVPRVLELTYTAVDLIPFAEDLWDCANLKIRRLFLEQRHGTKTAAFEEFIQYDTARLPQKAKTQSKLTRLAAILPPFVFDPERRATLRAALDARYARLYGLTRDDLRYILDPADLMGEDYPSETFRVLKEKETAEYGEYRTRRLVLEAWDAVDGARHRLTPEPGTI